MIFKHFIGISILLNILFAKFPDAVGYNGMVVSSNEYASNIGIEILKKGGNAIDAAIGVSFALAVVHPGAEILVVEVLWLLEPLMVRLQQSILEKKLHLQHLKICF